ncbi:MAG TPA: imidazole glycerol phosphate synthase cyclase subunit [Cyclobacteriaceae bacterium]|nr:imidazole glycerol phosphate synthase cyclase subunit [Cyclobacteriaceae bacterium]
MLKRRIIPTILWKDLGIVKGRGFNSSRRVGSLLPCIKVYNTRQVDELMILDITATDQDREPDYAVIDEIADECFVPLTVGGGVKTVEHIRNLLRAGADKVSINSACYQSPELVSKGADIFGVQCIVVSIDVFKDNKGKYECYMNSGKVATGKKPVEWAKEMELRGAGELLVTSINNDGEMCGYDIELIRSISDEVNIPVIASGGARNYDDLYKALEEGQASAVAAASIFHFTEMTPLEAKIYLNDRGVLVRKF